MMAEARVHPDPDALVLRELGQLFAVERALHHGRLASVYLARDLESGTTVALKTIARLPSLEAGSAERFKKQAALTARLDHAHIVPPRRHGVSPSFLWYTMDYHDGGALAITAMPVREALRVAQQIGSALDYAHRRGTLHADLRPANVLLDDSGWIRVSDFGVLGALGGLTALDTVQCPPGALDYIAPELLVPGGVPGPAADQYALAVMTYECLAGLPVFGAMSLEDLVARHRAGPPPDLSAVRRDAPPGLVAALRRAMSHAPGQRFPNVAEFSAALMGPATPRVLWPTPHADEDDEVQPLERPRHSRRLLLIGAAVTLVVLIVGGIWWAASPPPPSSRAADDEMVSARAVALPDPPVPDVVPAPATVADPTAPDARAAAPRSPPARVVVSSTPWAELYVDGTMVGNTPVVDLPLAAGRHRVRLVRPGFKIHEQVIYVAPGQRLRITGIVLQQETAP